MARVTIEDCLTHVPNRFDLVLLASKRARQLMGGVDPLLPVNNDKVTVIALREIADGVLDLEALEREPIERRSLPEEEYIGSPLDAEARDLMNEEIHMLGVQEDSFADGEEESFDALLGIGAAGEVDEFAGDYEDSEDAGE
ncbi:MAG: DNA-directed RNA polymerase subunit omega [Magnetococcales bacterium]|nr:DNA-directed RNA polymerase subunit omega [Magnetococcales bacterium]